MAFRERCTACFNGLEGAASTVRRPPAFFPCGEAGTELTTPWGAFNKKSISFDRNPLYAFDPLLMAPPARQILLAIMRPASGSARLIGYKAELS